MTLASGAGPDRLVPVRPGVLDPRSSDPAEIAALESWLRLQDALCLSPRRAVAWLEDSRGDPAPVVARAVAGGAACRSPVDLAEWRASLAALGAAVVPHPSPHYPRALRPIADPPPVLVVRGVAAALSGPAVGIVGARAATPYGLALAHDLGVSLAAAGVVVVSGLARGIDAAAHRGALEAGGVTVAVQACGADVVYPPEHRALAGEIARSGAVVTELAPGRAPVASHFPLRNRLISGLSLGVVVVEARPKSGSLITARHALDQGREVFAVPGPVNAPTSAGPNALLRDGARPVLEVADVLDGVGFPGRESPPPPGAAAREPEDERLLEELRESPCSAEALAARLGWSPRELALRLLGLELDGLVATDRDGRLRAVPTGVFR